MPSPFPGMDPWLERSDLFPDLHASLAFLVKQALNAVLPAGYSAITKNLVWSGSDQRREPDASIYGDTENGDSVRKEYEGLLTLTQSEEPIEQPYVEILDAKSRRLVTAIEILSPSNKTRGDAGFDAYREKQAEFLAAGVNLVEIDWLRAGQHVTAIRRPALKAKVPHDFHYHIAVTAFDPHRHEMAAIRLEDTLPRISIPLLPQDAPVPIDLQTLFTQAYDSSRYSVVMDYSEPPQPKLSPEDLIWANERLRAAGIIA
ncbi:MAG: DUF4058 family protein [Fimbriiglobus sp.]